MRKLLPVLAVAALLAACNAIPTASPSLPGQATPEALSVAPQVLWAKSLFGAGVFSDPLTKFGQAINLYSTGSFARYVAPSVGGSFTVGVNARGVAYNGPPNLALVVNGVRVANVDVTRGDAYGDYSLGARSIPANATMDIVYTNDAYGGWSGADRNVFVTSVTLTPPAPVPAPAPAPVATCTVSAGGSIQAAVNAAPSGATVTVCPGTYRERVTITQSITLQGVGNPVIDGADPVTNWTQQGGYWASNYTPFPVGPAAWAPNEPNCIGNDRCRYPDQVFIDGVAQYQALTLLNLQPGQFYVGGGLMYLGSDPTGHDAQVTHRDAWLVGVGSSNVTVSGFTMRHAGSALQAGGISTSAGSGWLIQNNDFGQAAGANVMLSGDNNVLSNNKIHEAGQIGLLGHGLNIRVIGNEIYANNTEQASFGFETGGMKLSDSATDPSNPAWENALISGNDVHDNIGNGIHTDCFERGATISNNRVHGNRAAGIIAELSRDITIDSNIVYGNGSGGLGQGGIEPPMWVLGTGIQASNSSNVEIKNNLVAYNFDGIGVVQVTRFDPYTTVTGVTVHDNTVVQKNVVETPFAIGFLGDAAHLTGALPQSSGFNNKLYIDPGVMFAFGGWPYLTAQQFSLTPGGQNTTFLNTAQRDAALAAGGLSPQ